MLSDSSCIINGSVEATAFEIFVGFDDNEAVIVVKLLREPPLAWC